MKKYVSPVVEINEFEEDIITLSVVLSEALQGWADNSENQPAIAAEVRYSDFTAFE